MIKISERPPHIGQKIYFYDAIRKIEAWFTYNPFSQEEDKMGFLYINPITKNLTWAEIFPHDEYEILNEYRLSEI